MEDQFTTEEKRKWQLKKHLKENAFAYLLDILSSMLFAYLLLKLCRAEEIAFGLLLSFAWALGRVIQQIHHCKKDYIDRDIG